MKEKEIIKLKTKIKALNSNYLYNKHNDNTNNNSNISMVLKSKANSSIYTSSKDDIDNNNKFKFDEFYTIFKDNQNNNDNIKKTMSNIKQSRNNNFFSIINRHINKKNGISQQNTIININSYQQKNYSTNNLRKNNSNNNRNKNFINSNRNKNYKLNSHNNSSLNITNNTYNMNKNNIMINFNPKNVNVNIEKLKVQKKLSEYQKLIDQKLNELILSKHPHIKGNKNTLHIRHNSSPNIYINNYYNSQRKYNTSVVGLEYYLNRKKKKTILRNISTNNIPLNKNNQNNSKKLTSKSTIDSVYKRKVNQKNKNKSQSMKKIKCSSDNIYNLKQNSNKVSFNSKMNEFNNSKHNNDNNNDSIADKEKTNLSLRKFIFAKCSAPNSNTINIH